MQASCSCCNLFKILTFNLQRSSKARTEMYTQVLSYTLILGYAIFGDKTLKLVDLSWSKSFDMSQLHVQIFLSLN